MRCEECNTSLILGHMHDGQTLCSSCKLKIDPPTIELKQFGEGQLYWSAMKVYEKYMSLEHFEKCGWFLRRKTEKQDKAYPGIYNRITTYHLIYIGDRACRRCGDFSFPKHFKPCHNAACAIGDTYDY